MDYLIIILMIIIKLKGHINTGVKQKYYLNNNNNKKLHLK